MFRLLAIPTFRGFRSVTVGIILVSVCLMMPPCAAVARDLSPTHKVLWAHYLNAFPLELDHLAPYRTRSQRHVPYGDDYPLGMAHGLEATTSRTWLHTDFEQIRRAGINALAVNVFSRGDISSFYRAADHYSDLAIAPCLDLSHVPVELREDEVFALLLKHCRLARHHASAALVDGAPVAFTFGGSFLAPEAWQRVRARLVAEGESVYLVGDIGAFEPGHDARRLAALLATFDAVYDFGGQSHHIPALRAAAAAMRRPFVGSIRPGYYRPGQGYRDAEASALYRRGWQDLQRADDAWACVITWNDLSEETQIMPTARQATLRSDLTAWHSSLWRGALMPFSEPRLYLTTPATLRPGEAAGIEALVLNPSGQLLDLTIYENAASGPPRLRARRLSRAREWTLDLPFQAPAAGAITYSARLHFWLSAPYEIGSAPILVLPPVAYPGGAGIRYLSVNATRPRQAPQGARLDLDLNDAGRPLRATITAPSPAAYLDLLHNHRIVGTAIGKTEIALDLPSGTEHAKSPAPKPFWGYYGVRTIGREGDIHYSTPRHFSPPAHLERIEAFDFRAVSSEGRLPGAPPHYYSAQARALTNDSEGSGTGFDGEKSRVELAPEITPRTPFEIEICLSPLSPGGMIFADTGGVILRLGGDYRVQWSVLAEDSRWVTVTTAHPIPKGRPAVIRSGWDGKHIYLNYNNDTDRKTLVQPCYRSGVRALGYNPYRGGSNFYNGAIINYKLILTPSITQ